MEVIFAINPSPENHQRQYDENRADPREPAAKLKLEGELGRRRDGRQCRADGLSGNGRERSFLCGGKFRDGGKRGLRQRYSHLLRQRGQWRRMLGNLGRLDTGARFQGVQLGVEPRKRVLEFRLLAAQREEKVAVFGHHGLG